MAVAQKKAFSGAAEGSLRHRRGAAARPCAGEHARLGHPQGAPRAARNGRCSTRWCRPGRSARTRCWSTSWPAASTTTASGPGSARRSRRSTCTRIRSMSPAPMPSGIVWAVGSKVRRWKRRRRSHRALQSGRRRRRGLQRRRSAVVAVAAHLGLRDAGRLVRAILPRAVAPADAQAAASDLGRIGLLHADAGHRLSHAVRPSAAHAQARRQRAGVGRFRRARRVRRAAGRRLRRQRHRHRLRRIESRIRVQSRRQGRHQPQGIQVLGRDAARSARPNTTPG